jgi:hypothetical protein
MRFRPFRYIHPLKQGKTPHSDRKGS